MLHVQLDSGHRDYPRLFVLQHQQHLQFLFCSSSGKQSRGRGLLHTNFDMCKVEWYGGKGRVLFQVKVHIDAQERGNERDPICGGLNFHGAVVTLFLITRNLLT